MKYHDNQRRAIEHFNGPALVLSGPGSGKTAVIVERIRTLIEKRNVNPEQILVVTFTKAAAKEMEMRFQNGMNGGRGKMVTFGTFHSVFWGILKETSGFRGKEIITEKEKSYLLKQCFLSNEMQTSVDEEFITNLLGEIARVKGNLEGIENAGKSEEFKRIFKQYQRALQLENRMDFEDILQETYHLLYSKKKYEERGNNVFHIFWWTNFKTSMKFNIELFSYWLNRKIIFLLWETRIRLFMVFEEPDRK
ncbi:MAG: UvrD-helicase domain-containing protein [Eubacterium sp.]|nr:UvrD-helicase domain-containing protein [Eubacterium sp.]